MDFSRFSLLKYMQLTLDHINVVVADMARAEAFYGDVLGMKRTFEAHLKGEWIEAVAGIPGCEAHCVFFEFEGVDVRLELLQYLTPERAPIFEASLPNLPGVRHFAFNVEDMDSLVAGLTAKGVEFVSPPVEVPFPVNGKRKRLCYFHDPDGTLLEVAEYSELNNG